MANASQTANQTPLDPSFDIDRNDNNISDAEFVALHERWQDLPYSFAKRYGVIAQYDPNEETIQLHYRQGFNLAALHEAQRFLGSDLLQHYRVAYRELDVPAFERLLAHHYDSSASGTQAMMDDLNEDMDLHDIADALPEPEDLLESDDDAPIIRLINALLTQAVKENASDIHIEVFENRMSVRMRIDGVLREVLSPPRKLASLVISRIKVMAKLDIAEKRLPQDGRISLKLAGRAVDVRVSTLPSGYSERIVLRLLDKQAGRLKLVNLGMATDNHEKLNRLIQRPHGIILVTGPTGSGKTTTLYAALSQINDNSRNILTVEDPVEYYLDGIGQTQVNSKVDMSFARGLRAILRQDPDVVMVGEIRDLETAEIAVQASLTGHLVFSTLHTNTAIGAINRLRDMGVEPFLLSSSLIATLSQRLIRKLCPHCKTPYEAVDSEKVLLEQPMGETLTLYHPQGCSHCNHTGYSGRKGIYELIEIDATLRQMIHERYSEMDMDHYVHQHTPSLRQDAIREVVNGTTSVEEVLRVTREEGQ
ncbi:MAG: type II secretion system ATPase GspE [bacterium]